MIAKKFIFNFRIYKMFSYFLSIANFSSTKFMFPCVFLAWTLHHSITDKSFPFESGYVFDTWSS